MKKILVILVLVLFCTVVYAEDRYSWQTEFDKETCDKAGRVGMKKGINDRRYGIKDNNKWGFVDDVCSRVKCTIGERAELATCYEIGYETGFYGR